MQVSEITVGKKSLTIYCRHLFMFNVYNLLDFYRNSRIIIDRQCQTVDDKFVTFNRKTSQVPKAYSLQTNYNSTQFFSIYINWFKSFWRWASFALETFCFSQWGLVGM